VRTPNLVGREEKPARQAKVEDWVRAQLGKHPIRFPIPFLLPP